MNTAFLNCLTIDVEDYFQVNAFSGHVKLEHWDDYPLRVDMNTRRVLDILDQYCIKATFFMLGWVAERFPVLSGEIQQRGHEIACHGYSHELIYRIGPARFRDDVRRAKKILEDQIGQEVKGYRAPSYSITNKSLWALKILAEEGFVYDSSIFPIMHDTYGIPGSQRFPYTIETDAGPLIEFPLTTFLLNMGWRKMPFPIAGGGYLRLLPIDLICRGIASINNKEKQPAVVYFHPWEIDPNQPRMKGPLKSRFRHYLHLHKTEKKLMYLFERLKFAPMKDVVKKLIAAEC